MLHKIGIRETKQKKIVHFVCLRNTKEAPPQTRSQNKEILMNSMEQFQFISKIKIKNQK